jgi:hypothetical protein
MSLPTTTHKNFRALHQAYQTAEIEFPQLKGVSFAQWAKECGWGQSNLAIKFKNYGGAKWRTYMAPYAKPVKYAAHDGITQYCHFPDDEKWIAGYWARFDLEPSYKGWRKHTKNRATFMAFIGPIWLGMGQLKGDDYVRDVVRIHDQYKFADDFKETLDENSLLDWDDLRRRLGGLGVSGLRGST